MAGPHDPRFGRRSPGCSLWCHESLKNGDFNGKSSVDVPFSIGIFDYQRVSILKPCVIIKKTTQMRNLETSRRQGHGKEKNPFCSQENNCQIRSLDWAILNNGGFCSGYCVWFSFENAVDQPSLWGRNSQSDCGSSTVTFSERCN